MTDLAELFSRDPLSYQAQDIELIVEEYRKQRHAFAAGNMKAGKATSKKTKKEKDIDVLASKVSISL